ncbi:MAG TPA: hypothetical protein DCZ41_05655 [Firmicutes bacterium]|nr:hypothetical protein [Bacillota bacterium]
MSKGNESNKEPFSKIGVFCKKHLYFVILFMSLLCASLISLFFSEGASPLYPAYSHDPLACDSNFFILGGKMIVEGKRLYLDLFDHKGMLAFLPSALGYMMGGYYGVCFVNWLFHLFAAFTMFLLVSELNDDLSFLLYNGSVYLLLWSLIDAGNANGLYVLPFGMLAYCFFLKGFKTKRRLFFLIGSLIGGIEIGIAFNIRPTDGLAIIPLFIFLFVLLFRKRISFLSNDGFDFAFKDFLYNALLALFGFVTIMGACYGYAYSQGKEYFDGMIHAVFAGTGNYLFTSDFLSNAIMSACAVVLFAILNGFLLFFVYKKDKPLFLLLLITSSFNVICNLAIVKFTHYWISYFPSVMLNFASFFTLYPLGFFMGKKKKVKIDFKKASAILASISLLVGVTFFVVFETAPSSFVFSKANTESIDKEINECISLEERRKIDNVFALDLRPSVYLRNGIETTIKYKAIQTSQATFEKEIETEIMSYLQSKKPKYVIVSPQSTELSYYRYIYSNYSPMVDNYPDNGVRIYQINESL